MVSDFPRGFWNAQDRRIVFLGKEQAVSRMAEIPVTSCKALHTLRFSVEGFNEIGRESLHGFFTSAAIFVHKDKRIDDLRTVLPEKGGETFEGGQIGSLIFIDECIKFGGCFVSVACIAVIESDIFFLSHESVENQGGYERNILRICKRSCKNRSGGLCGRVQSS